MTRPMPEATAQLEQINKAVFEAAPTAYSHQHVAYPPLGIDALRDSIGEACGLSRSQRAGHIDRGHHETQYWTL